MRLYWDNKPLFPANGAEVTSRTTPVLASSGLPVAYEIDISALGYLDGDTQTELTLAEGLIRAALAVPYKDLVFKQDDGNPSAHTIQSANAISGCRVVDGPHFEEAQGAEYVTRRTVRFTARARVTLRGRERAVMSWEETLSFTGNGGPVVSWRRAVNTKPVKQIVYPASTYRATQTGRAVGHLVRPTPPKPLWPLYEHEEQRRVTPEAGRRVGPGNGGVIEPAISWQYVFEADVPLVGLPNIPPI